MSYDTKGAPPQEVPMQQIQQPYEFPQPQSPAPQYPGTAYTAPGQAPPAHEQYSYPQQHQQPGMNQQTTGVVSPVGQPASPQQYHPPPQQYQYTGQPQQQFQHTGTGFQQQSQQRIYQTATPLAALNRGAAPVDCPACGQRAMTRISYETGNTTHLWAAGLCCVFCLGCIPYVMNSLKDVNHHCGNCGVLLATWHRSGAVEVHQHA